MAVRVWVEEILGTVAAARRRTCGKDRNVEGVKLSVQGKHRQAASTESVIVRRVRGPSVGIQGPGIKRQKCANYVTKLSGMKVTMDR